MGYGLNGVARFLPTTAIIPRAQVEKTLSLLPDGARICDVGAGGRRIVPHVVAVDGQAGPGVDVVGDIHALPIADNSFDCVFCTGTLEHVRNPAQAIQEIYRIVKPGGLVHIDVPFIQGYHPDPTDYWRFTLDGLRLLCEKFEEIDAGTYIGPTCGLLWVVQEWAKTWAIGPCSLLFSAAVAFLLAPLRYLDYFMIRLKRSHHVASAVYFRGRKPLHDAGQRWDHTESTNGVARARKVTV